LLFNRHFGVVEVATQAVLSPQPQTPVEVLHLLATPVVKTDGRHEFATHLHVSVVPPFVRAALFAPRHCGVEVPAVHAFPTLPHTQVPPTHLLYNKEPVQSESFAHSRH